MSLLVDEYRRNWAIRFLREARSDLSTADRTPIPAMSISLAVMAMRKAQTSVYYIMGDPSYLTPLVNNAIDEAVGLENAIMKFLVDFELVIRSCINSGERLGKEAAIQNAKCLIELVAKTVSIMTGIKAVDFA
ncbi:hypothetical protein MUP00_06035 [Candidatus Bathyarchaeota archaeon]|nr:hypothetical protein [Candidatus Bathyarchaeota archaeon]